MAKRFVTTKVEIEGREETKIVELPSRESGAVGRRRELHDRRPARCPRQTRSRRSPASRATPPTSTLPGMLYAAILRAPVASGRVTSLDLSPALALPGVRGAVTHRRRART